jgi:hypothetical protein
VSRFDRGWCSEVKEDLTDSFSARSWLSEVPRALLGLVGLALVVFANSDDEWFFVGAGLVVSLPILAATAGRVRRKYLMWFCFALLALALLAGIDWLVLASLAALAATLIEMFVDAALRDRDPFAKGGHY